MPYNNTCSTKYAALFMRGLKKFVSKSALWVLIFSFITMPASPALAVFDDYEGERRMLNQGFSLQPSETAGAMIYNVPLSAPPGRNGLQPDLSLSYNSNNTLNTGVFGYGWSLNIPYIERINKKGVEDMYSDKYFYSSLDGELREIDQGMAIAMLDHDDTIFSIGNILGEGSLSLLSDSSVHTPLHTLLADTQPSKRSTLKGQHMANLDITGIIQREKYDIQITNINAIQGGVQVFARVWDKKNKQIGFGQDGTVDIERFVMINPPVLVDDPNGAITREWVDDFTGETKTRKLREDAQEALLQSLEHTISVKKQKFGSGNIIPGKVGNTTLTAYPQSGTGTAPIDGVVARNGVNTESLSTLRSGAGNLHQDTNASTNSIILATSNSSGTDQFDALWRGGYGFDTSSIGSDGIDSATLSLYGASTTTDLGDTNIDVVSFSPASESDFVNSDYAIANFGSTRYATGIAITSFSTSAYNDFALNASGEAHISTSTNTFFGTRIKWDVDNNFTGTWVLNKWSAITAYYADEAGTSKDPKLVVEHSEVTGPSDPCTDEANTGYGAKIDEGGYVKYEYNSTDNIWCATDKRGTVYKFGSTAAERQDDPIDATRVFRWALEEVRDANDNYIKYEYTKDNGQIYPSTIIYTGHGSTDGIFEIAFTTESSGNTATSTAAGFAVKTDSRVSEIQAKENNEWVRKYEIDYASGDSNGRSLISSIIESGKDDQSATTTLPAHVFNYQSKRADWSYDSNYDTTVTNPNYPLDNPYTPLGDFDSDGLLDTVDCDGDGCTAMIQDYDGSGWSADTNYTVPVALTSNALSIDVDIDGFADFVKRDGDDITVYINDADGTGWTYDSSYDLTIDNPDHPLIAPMPLFGDYNGDQLPDIFSCEISSCKVYINSGSSWVYASSYTSVSGIDNDSSVVDVNGDGLSDFVNRSDYDLDVYINNGDATGWTEDTAYDLTFDTYDDSMPIGDINGDGLPDFMHKTDAGGCKFYINDADGTGWTEDSTNYSFPTNFDCTSYLADIDGDGLADLLEKHNSTTIKVSLNGGLKSDLLQSTNSSTGAEKSVVYKNTPEYADQGLLNPELPYSLPTVFQVIDGDGLGTYATTTYSYSNGDVYYGGAFDHRFAGFQYATTTNSMGFSTVNYFHQGNTSSTTIGEYSDHDSKIGKTFRTEVYDASDNLYQISINKWENYDLNDERDFVYMSRSLELLFDGDSDHKDKATEFTYIIPNGNLINRIFYGEVTGSNDGTFTDTGSDLASTTISYVGSSTARLLGLPTKELTHNQSASTVREVLYYYDDLPFSEAYKGNQTKQEIWKSDTTYIDTEKSYNTYGLVTQSKDARDKATNYTYDSNNLYVATSTNPLSQQTQYYYDYSSGKVATTTNANNHVFATVYDGLDRVITQKQPNLDTPSTLDTKTTIAYTDTKGLRKTLETNYLNVATSVTAYKYLDGFDRVYQERKEAETANIFSITDFVYNGLGQLASSTLPYFATGTGTTTPTATSTLYQHFTYDPLERVATTTNALGDTFHVYDQWQLTVTDAENNKKGIISDAYGNVLQVNEYNGSSTYSTVYEYDVANNLTKITDASSNIRNFTYDGLGQRLTAQDLHAPADAYFGTWTYFYDDAGNLATTTNPIAQEIDYYYDDLNRITTEDYTGIAGSEVLYAYDDCTYGIGLLCSATSTSAVLNYAYNPLAQIQSETNTLSSVNYQTTYDYDLQGNPTLITHPNNAETKYTYNTAGLLETVSTKENGDASYSNILSDIDYSSLGQITYQSFGNTASSTYTYDQDKMYQLTQKVTSIDDGGMEMASLGVGELEQITFVLAVAPLPVYQRINGLSGEQKATLKGQNIAKLNFVDTISRENYDIQIIDMNAIQKGVEVFVRAWDKKGKQIGFGRDGSVDIERFAIINPPILVDDLNGDIVRTWTDSITGETKQRKLREDLKEALLQTLESTLEVKTQLFDDSNIIPGKIGNTTLTAYPQAGTGTAPIDSAMDRTNASGESYSTIRDSAGTTANDTGSNEPVPYLKAYSSGSSWSDGAETNLRGGFGFDTSSIGSDQVDSATFSLWVTSTRIVSGWAAEDVVELTEFTPADGSDFATSDYNIAKHGSTRLATGIDLASMSTGAYNNWTLNASGEAAINKSSNTFFSTRWKFDVDDADPPTWENNNMYSFIYLADQSGTTNDPKLVVEHSEGPPPDPGSSELFQDLSYEYDNVGNITKITDISGYNSAKIVDYIYDDLYRLTTASTTFATTSTDYIRTYTYDALGNITNKSDQGAYGYGGNQGTNYANPHAVTDIASTTTYAYDKNGNLTSDGTWTHGWNYNNTLASSTTGVITVDYGYDYNKQRISYNNGTNTTYYPNKYYNTSTATTTRHIFAGNQLIATIQGNGTATTTNYIHTDHLGGTHIISDEDGNKAQLLDYYPFGDIRINEDDSLDEQRKFTGHMYDDDTSLYYMQARYQNPAVGRFASQDPAFLTVGNNQQLKGITGLELQKYLQNPQGFNSYSYAVNNPLVVVDANGEWIEHIIGQQNAVSLGNWATTLYDNNSIARTAMDHPYATGAVVGVGSGLAAYGGAAALTSLSTSYLGGIGTGGICLTGACANKAQVLINQAQGLSGEKAAGVIKNTERILVNGNTRIPDVLNKSQKLIGEVKTVQYQSLTSQLRDFMSFAQQNDYSFKLIVDNATKISGPLQQVVDAGKIILERAPLK